MNDYTVVRSSTGAVVAPGVWSDDVEIDIRVKKNTVTKFFFAEDDEEAVADRNHELRIFRRIQLAADVDNTFTVPIYASGIMSQRALNQFNFNSHIFERQIEKSAMLSFPYIVYGYGGIDMIDMPKIGLSEFLSLLVTLVKGIARMHADGYVHRDIKPVNLMYHGRRKRLFLVDFGLAIKTKNMYAKGEVFVISSSYPYFPPEWQMIKELMKTPIDSIESIGSDYIFQQCSKNLNAYVGTQPIWTRNRDSHQLQTEQWWRELTRQSKVLSADLKGLNLMKALFLEFGPTVDIYALGISIAMIVDKGIVNPNKHLVDLINVMMSFNMYERPNADQVVDELDLIVNEIEKYGLDLD